MMDKLNRTIRIYTGWQMVIALVVAACLIAAAAGASTKAPKPKPGFPNVFTLTVCDDDETATTDIGTVQAHIKNVRSSDSKAATAGEHGTNSLLIKGHNPGTTNVTFDISPENDGNYTTLTIEVTVIKCPRKKAKAAAVRPNAPANGVVQGLIVHEFETAHGKVVVNLPDDVAAGDTISGAVIGVPSGKSEAEQAKNQSALDGYVVAVDGNPSKPGDKWATWAIPAGAAGVAVALLDGHGHKVAEEMIAVAPAQPTAPAGATDPSGFHLPAMGQAGKTMAIHGPFDGNMATSHVSLDGRPCLPLAESPRQLVAAAPQDLVGVHTLEVRKNGAVATAPYRAMGFQLTASSTVMHTGGQIVLSVHATGLEGITSSVPMLLTNDSPEIVRMAGGDFQTVMLAPGQVGPDGSCTVDVHLTALKPGPYQISARLAARKDGGAPSAGLAFADAPAGLP
ncbi:MAG TPA: hypothetical protein VKT77_04870 [Chthonomonadaceae bacterium]|nr:hypothetical protein [Chthonomonadaceae bacterium]